jgi:hypothetical protein
MTFRESLPRKTMADYTRKGEFHASFPEVAKGRAVFVQIVRVQRTKKKGGIDAVPPVLSS